MDAYDDCNAYRHQGDAMDYAVPTVIVITIAELPQDAREKP